jgi:uncharacterized cupin superfamily protein
VPKLDIRAVPVENKTGYPEPYRQAVAGRFRQRLGNVVGLDQFGVNLTRLKPGAWSAQRHWHETEDEFVYVLEGELVLCEDGGELLMRAGDAAGFKANAANGHCLVNRTAADAVFLEIGTRLADDRVHYPDIDLAVITQAGVSRYVKKSEV